MAYKILLDFVLKVVAEKKRRKENRIEQHLNLYNLKLFFTFLNTSSFKRSFGNQYLPLKNCHNKNN